MIDIDQTLSETRWAETILSETVMGIRKGFGSVSRMSIRSRIIYSSKIHSVSVRNDLEIGGLGRWRVVM
jgi:hypothetical protein